jgi:hypothetical protein
VKSSETYALSHINFAIARPLLFWVAWRLVTTRIVPVSWRAVLFCPFLQFQLELQKAKVLEADDANEPPLVQHPLVSSFDCFRRMRLMASRNLASPPLCDMAQAERRLRTLASGLG